MKTLSFSPTFLPASWLTISPPSATSSANSGIILLVTSSCCICWGRGVVCMTETTCKCTAVVTKNSYHSDNQRPFPPLLMHTHCICYPPFPNVLPFPSPNTLTNSSLAISNRHLSSHDSVRTAHCSNISWSSCDS